MPLMGRIQAEMGVVSMPAACVSQAVADVGENMRAKVYSLFCKMGFTDLPGLTVEDHVTLTIIGNSRMFHFRVSQFYFT